MPTILLHGAADVNVWLSLEASIMSGDIRKQLGPVKKRLRDNIKATETFIFDEDEGQLRKIKSKLIANIKSHADLRTKLCNVKGPEDEQHVIDETLEECSTLEIDANEMIQLIDDYLTMPTREEKILTRVEQLEQVRIEQAIENY